MPAAPKQRFTAHLAMIVFSALIAGSFTFGAMAVPYLSPAALNGVRFVLAAILMAAFAFGLARRPLAVPSAPWRFAVTGFFVAVYFITMLIALTMTLPVATSAVYTLVPLMTAVTALVLLGQRSGPAVLLSLLFAGLGAVWVIFRGDLEALLALRIGRGELIFLLGCVSYAIYTPLLRKFSRGEPPLVMSFWTTTATAAWILLYGIGDMLATDWSAVPAFVWWSIVYLAVGPTAICFFLVQFASLHLPSARVIAYGYLTPAFVILFEAAVGHGWPTLSVAAGALVIVIGLIVLAVLPER
jgi:drug/metabolite transporter (DMT)-like permease